MKGIGYYIRRTLKATLGGTIAALAMAAALGKDNNISLSDGLYIASAGFSTMGVVFGVGNADPIPPK